MSKISDWATAHVASASKKDWMKTITVMMLLSILFFAMAFTELDSLLSVSPDEMHAFVKKGLERLL
jgi:hypothetical protein